MARKRKDFFTQKLQITISVLLGFVLWRISSTEFDDGIPKVVPSRIGIFISAINLISLLATTYMNTDGIDSPGSPSSQTWFDYAFQLHLLFFSILPTMLLLSVWIHCFKYKKTLQLFLKLRKKLEDIGVDLETATWRYRMQIYATFIFYVSNIVVQKWFLKCGFDDNSATDDEKNQFFDILDFFHPVFIFAAIFTLTCSLSFAGLRFQMIRDRLELVEMEAIQVRRGSSGVLESVIKSS